ncbi:uncharacterized protein LOC114535087 [Dendronephthya gigantea]|uniref:uncharacterized protein LOC114535087 n=1 Tax=Dendronephthya gigantea TaxID=151771 RepID=UPI00106902D2|nr:uncharacterized protein LOC114535087 [Dendronephthya gigantea]
MANEMDLIRSLIWGKMRQSLQKLLQDSPPPQIVRIENDFHSDIEGASLQGGNMLVLHKMVTDTVLIGKDNSDSQINIGLSCPTSVYMRPLKCKFQSCKVEDFKSIFPKVKYVRVKNFGSSTDDGHCAVNVGDLLKIMTIDKKKKFVTCQDVNSKEDKSLPYKCSVIFTPLQDCRRYTLSEVVNEQGLPARVCFESTRSQAVNDRWNRALKGVDDVVFHNEVTQYQVIATVLGGVGGQARCLGLPTDLPIQCKIAERLTQDFRNSEEVVRTLHKGFDIKNFVEKVNVFQDLKNIKIFDSIRLPKSVPQYQNSPRPARKNGIKSPPVSPKPVKKITTIDPNGLSKDPKSPPVSPKPVKKITKIDPNGPSKDPKCPLVIPRASYSAPDNFPAVTGAEHIGLSRSLHEDNTNIDEDGYVEMGIAKHYYDESAHREKNSRLTENNNSERQKTANVVKKNPPVSPKPIKKIKLPFPDVSSKGPKCLLVPSPPYSPSYSATTDEDSATTDEDDYVEMDGYHKKNSEGEANELQSRRNRNNDYEEVTIQPRWTAKQNHEFADPRVLLTENRDDAKQRRPVSAEYVIPLKSVPPQKNEYSEPNCYENMYVMNREPQTDQSDYQNVVPRADWQQLYSNEREIAPDFESSEYVEMTGHPIRLETS